MYELYTTLDIVFEVHIQHNYHDAPYRCVVYISVMWYMVDP